MSGGLTVVELRVHGVSGTPPQAMLSCPAEFLKEVGGGDKDAAFHRRADWIDDAAAKPRDRRRRLMEAYAWGGLTSRRASRALWLLLVPFSLVNLAHWMLPPVTHRRIAAAVVVALRLLALSFTLTLLLAMAVAVLDITMWQCGDLPYCGANWGPLNFLARQRAGVRLSVGALPLVVVILGLWLLGRQKTRPLLADAKRPPDAVVSYGQSSPLTDKRFWNHDPSVSAMRACHVIAWTAGLSALVLAAPLAHGRTDTTRLGSTVLLIVNALMLITAAAATASTAATGRGGAQAPRAQTSLAKLRGVALFVLAVTLGWVACRGDVDNPEQRTVLPGLATAIYWLIGVQVFLLLVVFVGTALAVRGRPGHARRVPGYRVTLRGFAGPFVALLGALLGGAISVGVGMWTAQLQGTVVYGAGEAQYVVDTRDSVLHNESGSFADKVNAVTEAAPLIVPPPYAWTSVATAALALVVVLSVSVLWCRYFLLRGSADMSGQPGTAEATLSENGRRLLARTRWLARLPDAGPVVAARLVTLAVLLVLASALLPQVSRWANDRQFELLRKGAVITAPVVVLAVGLVVLVIAALRNRQVRRIVAILWDVVTFWPQVNHPLTPPSYGGRTVWDLRTRMGQIVRDPAVDVVLVAHSQGTIIAAATLMQCDEPGEEYPLLTFGSPLRRLYAVNFPAYFGYSAMAALRDRLSYPQRWINLWCETDPIGGWIFSDELLLVPGDPALTRQRVLARVDVRILDFGQKNPGDEDFTVDEVGPVCKHSGFWRRHEYTVAMGYLQTDDSEAEVDVGATAPPTDDAM